ncbi:MAG: leucine-rich repeat protein, partial [Ruminococcus flavefaciens]|nr:leucine-rich repeat protein [Ruminococcus flavefaciens]
MRNWRQGQRFFVSITLAAALMLTEMQLTALAAPAAGIMAEVESEQAQTGEDAVQEQQSQEEDKAEGASQIGGSNTSQEQPIREDTTEDAALTEDNTAEESPADGENESAEDAAASVEIAGEASEEMTEEDAAAAQTEAVEAAEELSTDTASGDGFTIKDDVLTAYAGTDTDIVIPNTVIAIGKNAFKDNKTIETVTFPASVVTIGNRAFYGCSDLKSVTFVNGLKTIDEEAFCDCVSLEKSELPSTVTAIGNGAFKRCTKLKTVKLNEGLKTIGDLAFASAGMGNMAAGENLIIPGTVESIGSGAFYSCKYLETVTFENGENEVLDLQSCSSNNYPTFGSCENLTKVELPERLKTINRRTFNSSEKLKEVSFGSRLDMIGNLAFAGCISLEKIELPSTVTTIENEAFKGCTGLKSVKLNEGLKTIGNLAFASAGMGNMAAGENLIIPGTVESIGDGAFGSCKYLETVKFENGENEVLDLKSGASNNRTFAFCENLTKVELPERLKTINWGTFQDCKKLKEVSFGSRLDTIGSVAFSGCESLERIELPSTVTTIGENAFKSCTGLKSVKLNEGLKTIGNFAFSGTGMGNMAAGENLVIPSTVESIGHGAFSSCQYLETVTFENGANEVLDVLSGYQNTRTFAFCENLTAVILPERITALDWGAFASNPELEILYIPEKVKEIHSNAVMDCPKLTIYGVPGSMAQTYANEKGIPFKDKSELDAAKVQSVSVTPEIIEETGGEALGKQIQLYPVVLPNYAKNKKVTYSSDNEQVASVDENGLVTIKGYGEAKITVTTEDGGKTAECAVYITEKTLPEEPTVSSVQVTPSSIRKSGEKAIGEKIQLYVEVLPDTAQNKKVTYSSDNEQVASVDERGLVTIKGYGEAKITVTTEDGGKTAECAVYITQEESPEKPTVSKKPEIKENLVFFPKKAAVYSAVYTGEQIRPVMVVYHECEYQDAAGNTKTQRLKLKLNVDYTVRYTGNINAGENTATVTVRGIGEYGGTVSKNFTVKAKNIKSVGLSPVGDILYGQTPTVVVTDGNRELKEETDYIVEYTPEGSANANTTAKLTVKGTGNYTGTSKKSVKFNILKTSTDSAEETDLLPMNEETVSIGWKNPAKVYTYNGKAQKPAVVVTDIATGKKLSGGKYKVIYSNNINAGDEAKAYVVGLSKNGKGYYGMTAPLTFSIKKKAFNKISAAAATVPKAGSIEEIQNAVRESLVVKDG